MATLIYSPGVRIFIETEKHGVIDVSEDAIEGSLVRRTDGVSTFDFSLNNARRKYDGVFMPNDRIVVLMKRMTWLRVFTGYLNSVPLKTAWPQPVTLSASCSLKRLQYWFWDALTAETQTMVAGALSTAGQNGNPDGQVINVILSILKEVVGWPEYKVHIGRIPEDWFEIALKIAERVDEWAEEADELMAEFLRSLGPSGTANGQAIGGSVAGVLKPGNYGGQRLSGEQLRNAETVYSVGANMGMSVRDIQIGLATAMTESNLIVVNQANSDRDSAGIFQQRPSQGWGTVKQVMDPEHASKKFFQALKRVKGRDNMQEWEAAYKVQRCAEEYKTRYQDDVPMARDITRAISRAVGVGANQVFKGSLGGGGKGSNGDFLAHALDLVHKHPNIPYSQRYGGTQVRILRQNPPPALDCSSFVQAIHLRALGKVGNCPRVSSAQAAWCKKISARKALQTPGALLFVSNNGRASGVHHVEVSMGNGKTVGAHRTGTPAGVAPRNPGYWSFGGLMPSIDYSGGSTAFTGSVGGGTTVGGTKQWPVAAKEITTAYKKPGSWQAGYHTGIDFGNANTGDKVEAVCEGKVIGAGTYGDYGQTVRVKTNGIWHMYCHLSSIAVNVGDRVTKGQKLGEVGNTGRSFGDHLHFEVRKAPYKYGEDDQDPKKFITEGLGSAGGFGAGGAGGGGGAPAWEPSPPASQLPGYDPNDPIDKLFGDNAWMPLNVQNDESNVLANALTGVRALMNDQPLLPYIKNLFSSTMRSFCSAPNGDLIGWFPDYYGLWGTAAKLRVEPIEIQDFNVTWSDDFFVTHQYALAGQYAGLDLSTGSVSTVMRPDFETLGIANVDIPEMMYALFGIEPDNHEEFAQWIYKRFGARPDYQHMEGLVGPKAEFFAAIFLFMRQWAYQYNADVPVTFMPEAWPGMLLQVPHFDFQAYITTVTHTFRFGEGGGFNTQINIAAPAYMPRKGKASKNHALFGLPQAGPYAKHNTLGPPPKEVAPTPIGRALERERTGLSEPRTGQTGPGLQEV